MTPQREEALQFLALASRDRDTFRILVSAPGASVAAMGFHAQQAAEKALKAVLFHCSGEFRRTHDLQELADNLKDAGVALPMADKRLRLLTPFAVEVRYQAGDTFHMPREEMAEIMEKTVAWAEQLLDDCGREA